MRKIIVGQERINKNPVRHLKRVTARAPLKTGRREVEDIFRMLYLADETSHYWYTVDEVNRITWPVVERRPPRGRERMSLRHRESNALTEVDEVVVVELPSEEGREMKLYRPKWLTYWVTKTELEERYHVTPGRREKELEAEELLGRSWAIQWRADGDWYVYEVVETKTIDVDGRRQVLCRLSDMRHAWRSIDWLRANAREVID